MTYRCRIRQCTFGILLGLAMIAVYSNIAIAQPAQTEHIRSFMEPQAILDYWFELEPAQWFMKSDDLDEEIRAKFGDWVVTALDQTPTDWQESPLDALALILTLDQFTRNIYRNTAQMYAGDEAALAISLVFVEKNWLKDLTLDQAKFALMPMMHSESIEVQRKSIPLFKKYTDKDTVSYAERHLAIIQGFGRFPHRNEILGRESTESEVTFLEESSDNSF